MRLTRLEHAILAEYRKAYVVEGFPAPDEIAVLKRENSGSGRFVDLDAPITRITQRVCDLPTLRIEMEGVERGLDFVLFLEAGRPDMLELFGYESWDGEERPWRLVGCDPPTRVSNA